MTTSTENGERVRDQHGRFLPGNQLARGGPGPRGHCNNFRHGLRRSDRFGFELARLPAPCTGINKTVRTMRRILEHLVLEAHGELGPVELMLVQTACRHEQTARQIQRWLNLKGSEMSHSERLAYLTAFSKESTMRDKAVQELRLQRDVTSEIDALYLEPAPKGS